MAARNLTLAIVACWRTATEVQVAPFLGNERCAGARGGTTGNRYKEGGMARTILGTIPDFA
ncbi:MAG TPA: hypothetical protein VHK68_01890 [Gemmatimonadales bacterium]|nr:hypothetical protein [Gemmatimonadales bacterium]